MSQMPGIGGHALTDHSVILRVRRVAELDFGEDCNRATQRLVVEIRPSLTTMYARRSLVLPRGDGRLSAIAAHGCHLPSVYYSVVFFRCPVANEQGRAPIHLSLLLCSVRQGKAIVLLRSKCGDERDLEISRAM